MRCAAVTLLLVNLTTTAAVAADPEVLLVGDSWAQQMYDDGALAAVLASHGHAGIGVVGDLTAISGSKASEWALETMLELLTDELAAHPAIEVVVIFIGGNDFLAGQSGGGWYVGMPGDAETALFAAIESDVTTLVDHLLGLNPDLEVILSSYDYPNFVETLSGLLSFICQPLWTDLGSPTPLEINSTATLLDARHAAIAAARPRVTAIAHWGLMQFLYGYPALDIEPGDLPLPGDPTLPSPPQAMRFFGSDCFHLASAGYEAIAERLWELFLRRQFESFFHDDFESGDVSAWSSSVGYAP